MDVYFILFIVPITPLPYAVFYLKVTEEITPEGSLLLRGSR